MASAFQLLRLLLIAGVAAASFETYEVKNVKSIRPDCANSSKTLQEYTHGAIKVRHKRAVEMALAMIFTAVAKVGATIPGIVAQFKQLEVMRENNKIQERQFEEEMKRLTTEMCLTICVTNWEPWTRCSVPCGGGTRTRRRQSAMSDICKDSPCPHALEEEAPCNVACANGGIPSGNGYCSCTRRFHGRCCNNEHICDYPGKPLHGHLTGVIPAQFGGVVSYRCSDGFALVGQDTIVCQERGRWDGLQPECKKINCSKPEEPENGQLLSKKDAYEFGEEVVYRCNNGYDLAGPQRRKCTNINGGSEGTWTSFTPLCMVVNCHNPGYPRNGHSYGTKFTLGHVVTFSCLEGFRLLGSESRECQANGEWSGQEPECELITCGPPFIPRDGRLRMTQETYHYGIEIRYMCNKGFQIEGNVTSTCLADKKHPHLGPGGKWSHEPPTCKPKNCGDPGTIENGAKDGSLFDYPNNVTFICFDGFILQGAAEIHCGHNGDWSAPPPTCSACPMNTYTANSDGGNKCLPCPENTHTVTNATNSVRECICNSGWTGQPGGPCTEVTCPTLTAPPNGHMNCEGNKYSNKCHISCDIGHIMDKGSSIRICQDTGTWTGTDASCSACPRNTYQSNQRSCLPCPVNSHTSNIASVKNQCVCDQGYQGPAGGLCEDEDECSHNGGHGPCKDICRNTVGSYVCECSIPGYIIDADKHACKLQDSCRNLTETDAPANGGLVCHWFYEQNSQQCSVRCNPGYEIPSQTNDFVTCGSPTNFTWTHELLGREIGSCIEGHLPDFRIESNASYFVRNCRDLTLDEQQKVKEDFAKMLTDRNICVLRSNKVCEAKNVGIICGATQRRRKRGVLENVDEVNVIFDLDAKKLQPSECDKICPMLRIPRNRCAKLCVLTYRRFLKSLMFYTKSSLNRLFSDARRVSFHSVQRLFEFQPRSLKTSDVIVDCPSGMTRDDICVPCEPGTFYSETENECVKCPENTYQADPQQTSCVPCPRGTYAPKVGASACSSCPENKWGDNCTGTCHCEHGQCDAESGQCSCDGGWEGPQCNIDIQSCTAYSCYPGVKCHDIPAPGIGFQCDPCPTGFQGDGTICKPRSSTRRIYVRSVSESHALLAGLAFDDNSLP